MKTKRETFVWFATHPTDGDLIIVCKPGGDAALVYSTRMIRDRLGPNPHPGMCVELGLGPMGFIRRDLYLECGVTAPMPFDIRLITIVESKRLTGDDETLEMRPENNEKLVQFMLDTWNSRGDLPV